MDISSSQICEDGNGYGGARSSLNFIYIDVVGHGYLKCEISQMCRHLIDDNFSI